MMRLLSGLVASLLLLVGCSSADQEKEEGLHPLPAEVVEVEPVADRDVNAVSASVSMLDPCALLRLSTREEPNIFATGQCDIRSLKIELNATLPLRHPS